MRDRDRLIHSAAFRRLEHKTQVFVQHEGDNFRSRLTHTIEVAQIARTIATRLNLDSDLAETIALAHDLGHTPFGHAGEEALNNAMKNKGGFDHNAQTLRIVTKLEKKYAAFDGLNLTWESLEGIVKHNGPLKNNIPTVIKDYQKLIKKNNSSLNLNLDKFAGPEAQVAASAYKKIINENNFRSVEDIRNYNNKVICFSKNMFNDNQNLRKFLFEKMYKHTIVNRMTLKAKSIVEDLFNAFSNDTSILPLEWREIADNVNTDRELYRTISDYIAGMTDRYAVMEHKRLYDLHGGWTGTSLYDKRDR